MDHLPVIFTYIFSSIIMIIFLPDTLVKIKHWNLFTVDIPGPVSMLMYNNSASFMSLVYDLSYNITSPINLLNNFPFLTIMEFHFYGLYQENPIIFQV